MCLERKKSLTRWHVKNIGFAGGIQSYEGQVMKRLCPGRAFVISRYLYLFVMAVLSGAFVVRVLLIFMAAPCCCAAWRRVGGGTWCGRLLSPLGRASTRRFLFLMMPRRRDCAKSVIEFRIDFNRLKSWAFALWSVAG